MNTSPFITLKKNSSFLILSIVILLSSCESNVIDDETGTLIAPGCDPEISYSTKIQPIISSSCIQCHNGSVQSLDFNNFFIVQSNAQKIKTQTQNRTMPLNGSLSQEEIDAITCWVDNGAKNN